MTIKTSSTKIMSALKKMAKTGTGQSVNGLRIVLALERIVARLERHPKLSQHLVFKGGFVLYKLLESPRFTHDVDALAIGLSHKKFAEYVQEALETNLEDGFWFGDIRIESLIGQGQYHGGGRRFSIAFQIGPVTPAKIKHLSRVDLDIGLGDALESIPKKQSMPSILEIEEPTTWSIYPLEYIFAEKLEALFSKGSASSRAKDIYDMPLILKRCKDIKKLRKAIKRTFDARNTEVPASFAATAREYKLNVLRGAWASVEQMGSNNISFETAWTSFLRALSALDANTLV